MSSHSLSLDSSSLSFVRPLQEFDTASLTPALYKQKEREFLTTLLQWNKTPWIKQLRQKLGDHEAVDLQTGYETRDHMAWGLVLTTAGFRIRITTPAKLSENRFHDILYRRVARAGGKLAALLLTDPSLDSLEAALTEAAARFGIETAPLRRVGEIIQCVNREPQRSYGPEPRSFGLVRPVGRVAIHERSWLNRFIEPSNPSLYLDSSASRPNVRTYGFRDDTDSAITWSSFDHGLFPHHQEVGEIDRSFLRKILEEFPIERTPFRKISKSPFDESHLRGVQVVTASEAVNLLPAGEMLEALQRSMVAEGPIEFNFPFFTVLFQGGHWQIDRHLSSTDGTLPIPNSAEELKTAMDKALSVSPISSIYARSIRYSSPPTLQQKLHEVVTERATVDFYPEEAGYSGSIRRLTVDFPHRDLVVVQLPSWCLMQECLKRSLGDMSEFNSFLLGDNGIAMAARRGNFAVQQRFLTSLLQTAGPAGWLAEQAPPETVPGHTFDFVLTFKSPVEGGRYQVISQHVEHGHSTPVGYTFDDGMKFDLTPPLSASVPVATAMRKINTRTAGKAADLDKVILRTAEKMVDRIAETASKMFNGGWSMPLGLMFDLYPMYEGIEMTFRPCWNERTGSFDLYLRDLQFGSKALLDFDQRKEAPLSQFSGMPDFMGKKL